MNATARLQAIIHWLARVLQMVAGIALLATAIGVTVNALMRYGLHRDIPVITEEGGFLFLFVVFFGLAATLAAGSHISVEVLAAIAPRRFARFMYDVVVPILSMIFVAVVMVAGAIVTHRYFASGRMTMGSTPLPFWMFIAIVPIGCVAMELSLLSQLIDGIRSWRRSGGRSSGD